MAATRKWQEKLKYYYYRLVRQSGEPEYLARGAALGLFVSFFIPIGFQIIVVVPLSILFKASKVLSIVGTFVTNWVTIFFFYPLQCWIGSYIILRPLSYAVLKEKLRGVMAAEGSMEFFRELLHLGAGVIIPFFVGGLVLAVAFAVPGYYLTLKLVRSYRRHREARRQARLNPDPENANRN